MAQGLDKITQHNLEAMNALKARAEQVASGAKGGPPPRKIYIDLGASWANSLRLWEDDFGPESKHDDKK